MCFYFESIYLFILFNNLTTLIYIPMDSPVTTTMTTTSKLTLVNTLLRKEDSFIPHAIKPKKKARYSQYLAIFFVTN